MGSLDLFLFFRRFLDGLDNLCFFDLLSLFGFDHLLFFLLDEFNILFVLLIV